MKAERIKELRGTEGECRTMHKICDVLVLGLFNMTIEPDGPKTAEEANTAKQRAYDYYNGFNPKRKRDEFIPVEQVRFRGMIDVLVNHLMREAIEPLSREIVHELLDALESAQSENERYKAALTTARNALRGIKADKECGVDCGTSNCSCVSFCQTIAETALESIAEQAPKPEEESTSKQGD